MHARPHHIPLDMLTRRRSGTRAPVARPGLRARGTRGARVRRISQRRERCALGNRVERVEETGESLGGAAGADETQPPGSLAALGHAGSAQSQIDKERWCGEPTWTRWKLAKGKQTPWRASWATHADPAGPQPGCQGCCRFPRAAVRSFSAFNGSGRLHEPPYLPCETARKVSRLA